MIKPEMLFSRLESRSRYVSRLTFQKSRSRDLESRSRSQSRAVKSWLHWSKS